MRPFLKVKIQLNLMSNIIIILFDKIKFNKSHDIVLILNNNCSVRLIYV